MPVSLDADRLLFEKKMKNENYITIQGWMRNELNLKGNELLVYALIYGFSQDKESEFTGSIAYIAEWIGSTKQTVHNTLKSLCTANLLEKKDIYHNGIKFCSYKAILPVVKNFDGVVKNFDTGGQKILPNNNSDNTIDKIDIYSRVVNELNAICGTHYKTSTKTTRDLIDARIKEGFTENDFFTVIAKKASTWKGTKMEQYLRPQTLFGTKFECYLNEKISSKNPFLDMLNERQGV